MFSEYWLFIDNLDSFWVHARSSRIDPDPYSVDNFMSWSHNLCLFLPLYSSRWHIFVDMYFLIFFNLIQIEHAKLSCSTVEMNQHNLGEIHKLGFLVTAQLNLNSSWEWQSLPSWWNSFYSWCEQTLHTILSESRQVIKNF